MKWGTTYSQKYAKDLGLDWKQAFKSIFDSIKFETVRLCAYWDEIEASKDSFSFANLDWLIEESTSRGIEVTLSLGRKVPRWPEYHEPSWVKANDYSFLEKRLLNYIDKTVSRYNNHSIITRWQIENEPFWSFGNSDYPIQEDTVHKEYELVKGLDNREIVCTDTGTWSSWRKAAKYGDQIGVNIYPIVYKQSKYFRQPEYSLVYRLKKLLISKPILISELQAEPWGPGKVQDLDEAEWQNSISIDKLNRNILLAKRTGIDEAWLWGCEWWEFLKQNGNTTIFNHIKEIING
ncbi:endo-1,4-beta-xylanase [Candidatus Dojkabacteria bacterium]|uniref:Endo-1,4-beta-xylanase n=1 Tax=Candidatus Dojkabacteria bacterium TaxID=2099670 RepID=A0A955RJ19_9BACT|nr:endo-1,4-beta-xylanase [Candidatus Dojkabacteria bacterium]